MRRRLFTLVSLLSLLLCAAAVAVWIRSRVASDYLEWSDGYGGRLGNDYRRFWIVSQGGGLFVWDYLHIQGYGGFAGGAAKIQPGREFQWEHETTDLEYPASPLKQTRQYEGGTLIHGRRAGCEFLLARAYLDEGFKDRTLFVLVPLPLVIGVLAIAPASYVASTMKRRRRHRAWNSQICPACSYDLTGNASGVCPECGTAIKSKDVPIKIA